MINLENMTCIAWGGYQYFSENINKLKEIVDIKYILGNKKYIDNTKGYIILNNKNEILKFKNPYIIISQAKDADIKNAVNWCEENDIPYVHLDFLVNNGKYKVHYIKSIGGQFTDSNNNTIKICPSASDNIIVETLEACNSTVEIGNINVKERLHIKMMGKNGKFRIGDKTSIISANVIVNTDGNVVIGNECMFSHTISIMQSDMHHIFDMNTHKRINYPKDIYIGNHVWVGRECELLSGAEIGDNSICGARTTTSSRFPANVIIAGCPGKIVREGIIWSRDNIKDHSVDFFSECNEQGALKYLKKEEKQNKIKYDYLVVGSGLYGAVFAHEAKEKGKSVLVIDKRPNIAGNVYTEKVEGINFHKYGAHIFHTNNTKVWNYITQFANFNRFTNSPVANYKGELYSMPFNMYTFNKMWGVVTPEEAAAKIEEQKAEIKGEPQNLEEQAISLVGRDIYEKLVKGYTEKQWGRDCKELPAFIIKRLPVRLTFDNNYFNALYQGIPVGGYTKMVENLLDGIEVRLNEDYLEKKAEYDAMADKVIYTGAIDAYFNYSLGNLEYRSVRFENEILDKPNFQGNAAVNYTDRETPWTRIIEHKWFEFGKDENGNDLPKTIISKEYSSEWKPGDEPYYPVNDEKNGKLYADYKALADKEEKVIFGGRLGEYKYYDMDAVIASALDMCEKELA